MGVGGRGGCGVARGAASQPPAQKARAHALHRLRGRRRVRGHGRGRRAQTTAKGWSRTGPPAAAAAAARLPLRRQRARSSELQGAGGRVQLSGGREGDKGRGQHTHALSARTLEQVP